ncbi:hypothetical protein IGK28_002606 [Enterococcus sp. DIV0182]|uniref:hypothetical protein n=1 Tax=Enterococcus TaxID=1350 RepID=UPI0039A6B03F
MYLKKVSKKDIKKYGLETAFGVGLFEGAWYYKMHEDGTNIKSLNGSIQLTRMAPEGLEESLESGEFTKVVE